MRLLNARSGKIEAFAEDLIIPPYAVLSHTWGPEEITLQEWNSLPRPALHAKQGYFKIKCSRQQALRDGLEYVWVDTCCIDRRSAAEHEDAVNSMFRWYASAAVCYAHLEDIAQPVLGASLADALRRSRWFTRSWTLQELIAPPEVVFYSTGWEELGTKTELVGVISLFTGIDAAFLQGQQGQVRQGREGWGKGRGTGRSSNVNRKGRLLASLSVSRRMSWAAGRKTSRPEDMAYSLIGILGVTMSPMYGEGKKRAFRRLQEEVMRAYPTDHTLFAWCRSSLSSGELGGSFGKIVRGDQRRSDAIPQEVLMDEWSDVFGGDGGGGGGLGANTGKGQRRQRRPPPLLGLLADSPDDFMGSEDLVPITAAAEIYYYGSFHDGGDDPTLSSVSTTSNPSPPRTSGRDGIVLDLPLLDPEAVTYHWRGLAPQPSPLTQLRWGRAAVLFCHRKGDPYEQFAIPITPTGPASYGRTGELIAGNFHQHIWQPATAAAGEGQGTGGPSRVFIRPEPELDEDDDDSGDCADGRTADSMSPALVHNPTPNPHLSHGDLIIRRWVVGNNEDLMTGAFRDGRGHVLSSREGLLRVHGQPEGGLLWSLSALTETETLCTFIKRGSSTGAGGSRNSLGPAASVHSSLDPPPPRSNGTALGPCAIEIWPMSRRVTNLESTMVDAHGTTWFPHAEDEAEMLALADKEALYRYVFRRTSSDTWLSPAIGSILPMITAKMERVLASSGESGEVAVDVIDLVAPYAPGTPAVPPTPPRDRFRGWGYGGLGVVG